MNLLRAQSEEDVDKIINLISKRLEKDTSFSSSKKEEQIRSLKKQLLDHMAKSKQYRVPSGGNKIMVTCAIRFYPKTQSYELRFPEMENFLPSSDSEKPLVMEKPSTEVMRSKAISIKRRHRDYGDCETNDGSLMNQDTLSHIQHGDTFTS